ncbi:lipocalin-like domain-containing protein [Fluviispira multicolorata]|uniref:Lipocalin-like domain-containing protein n=1 Tax=Fluviispira multicolorata TaxID=2654512 RepID=A0A833JBH1_9BACT|nr:lipocalin-like domain-containing protein [Fluviispira multicolorata]KAB8029202.1 hypothetical protein GCL57_11745 [Fluviispira multicolorata]
MKQKIVGTWMLKKFNIKNNSGIRKWRENSHGILLYTIDGYVSVNINSNFESESEFIDSILCYSGTYEIDKDKIRHSVMNASSFSRIGKIMEREYTLDGNNLVLTGRGDFGAAILHWERV